MTTDTATDPTALALLRAVLSDPADDLPRLVLADWWEEQGCDRMARFVRVAVGRGDDYAQGEFRLAVEHTLPFDAAAAFGLPDGWDVTCYEKLHDIRAESPLARSALTRRGFVARLACPADVWLRHADQLYWHPAQTVPCEHCREGLDLFGIECPNCDRGRVPREMPPTAQPLERVALTTWEGHPEVLEHRFLEDRWPGITFFIPPAAS